MDLFSFFLLAVRIFNVAGIGPGTLCRLVYRLRPNTANDRLHQGHQPLPEECVGKAVPGLAHRAGAEWRGAQNVKRTGRVLTAARTRVMVWPCGRHGRGLALISLRAARERLPPPALRHTALLWALWYPVSG